MHTHTHIHTEAPAHMRILTIQNLIYTQLNGQQRREAEEDITVEWKTWQVYCFGEKTEIIMGGFQLCRSYNQF